MRVHRVWALVGLVLAPGCGAATAPRARRLAEELAALEGTAAAQTESAARARAAAEEAARAERAGQTTVADEHASRARAWAHAAVDEAEAAALDERLGTLEAELLDVETEAASLEHAAAQQRRAHQAAAATQAVREETLRALLRAEVDESAPRRGRRLGLGDDPQLARLASVLAERARVLLAAAVAMGASEATCSSARAALEAAVAEGEPATRLRAADRAHGLARAALAEARHRRGEAPSAEEIAAFAEALTSEGFAPYRDERGFGARLDGVFEGAALAASARGRIRRLGELLASHPAGPVVLLVEADPDRAAQAQATRRLEALRQALIGSREREVVVAALVEVRVPGAPVLDPGDGARVVLPAYVPHAPTPAVVGPSTEPSAAADTATGSEE